jgi:hypothetical protein
VVRDHVRRRASAAWGTVWRHVSAVRRLPLPRCSLTIWTSRPACRAVPRTAIIMPGSVAHLLLHEVARADPWRHETSADGSRLPENYCHPGLRRVGKCRLVSRNHDLDTVGVTGSIPVSPTTYRSGSRTSACTHGNHAEIRALVEPMGRAARLALRFSVWVQEALPQIGVARSGAIVACRSIHEPTPNMDLVIRRVDRGLDRQDDEPGFGGGRNP